MIVGSSAEGDVWTGMRFPAVGVVCAVGRRRMQDPGAMRGTHAPRSAVPLSDQFAENFAAHVGKAELTPLIRVRQFRVVDS